MAGQVVWKSSDTSVLTIKKRTGVYTTVKKGGPVVVTATLPSGEVASVSITVT